MRVAWQWQVNQIFIELHPLALQQQKGSNEVWVLQDLPGYTCWLASPKSWGVCGSSDLFWRGQNSWDVVVELKRCWDYPALCIKINFCDVLGWINVCTYWWGDSCAKRMGKLSGVWGMHIGVYTLGKGTRICNTLEKQLLQSVKCQKRLNHNRQETLRREQSGIGKTIFRITWHDLINILGGSYHMLRNRRIITSIPACLLSGFLPGNPIQISPSSSMSDSISQGHGGVTGRCKGLWRSYSFDFST